MKFPFMRLTFRDIEGIVVLSDAARDADDAFSAHYPLGMTFADFHDNSDPAVVRDRKAHDAACAALGARLSALLPEALIELTALVWVGRDGATYHEALAHARRNTDSHDADYLTEKATSLSYYLRRGLERIGGSSASHEHP